MDQYDENASNPYVHTRKMKAELHEIVKHLRKDIEVIEDAQCKAMFETSAEVLLGIIKAFEDYEQKNEPAWK